MTAEYATGEVEAFSLPSDYPDPALALCHDLRQPVAAIIMLAAAAAAEDDVPPAVLERLEHISSEAEWLSRMISDALDTTMDDERVDLDQIVAEVVEETRATSNCQVELRTPHPMVMHANGTLVRRAVANLLENASRAAGAGGTVQVHVRRATGLAVIEVEDDGPGYGNIEKHSGFGLGVVRFLASRHGGAVLVGRSRLGGARIRLAIPLYANHAGV